MGVGGCGGGKGGGCDTNVMHTSAVQRRVRCYNLEQLPWECRKLDLEPPPDLRGDAECIVAHRCDKGRPVNACEVPKQRMQ